MDCDNLDGIIENILEKKDWILIDDVFFKIRDKYWSSNAGTRIQELYNKLNNFACKGNTTAIKCMHRLVGYRLRFDPIIKSVYFPDFIKNELSKYLSKLPSNERENYLSQGICDQYIIKMIQIMDEENCALKKEVDRLKTELKYIPGGIGYQEAKREFDITVGKI